MPEDSADWAPDRKLTDEIIQKARGESRTILTEFESKEVLSAYGIPVAKTIIAADAGAAVKAAGEIGYPWCSRSTPKPSRTRRMWAACS